MIKITAKRDGDGVAIFCNSAAVTNATELINKAMKFDEVVNV